MSRRSERIATIVEPQQEEFERQRGVTGIAVEDGLAHVVVEVAPDLAERLKVFRALADAGISLSLIKFHPDSIHFIVRKEAVRKTQEVLRRLNRSVRVTRDCAMVTVLSSAMRDLPGVMARVAEAIYEQEVELLETGDSHDAVMLLVRRTDAEKVAEALRKKFGLNTPPVRDKGASQAPQEG
ncbi:Aspartokinase [bacterium HR17]|jgi:aspartate kinase|uniref:aspartate kinase n=1 Tax=Candidatus Fervidibacter japonicus TaxID=2035412 RepID=A0A2H5XDT8_9BACT|nr:Aspartokinase [bacterium HR17]